MNTPPKQDNLFEKVRTKKDPETLNKLLKKVEKESIDSHQKRTLILHENSLKKGSDSLSL